MYYEDLSPYAYAFHNRSLAGVLNVGWLSTSHAFATGETPPGFLQELKRAAVEFSVNQMRGRHVCEFCIPDWMRELEARPPPVKPGPEVLRKFIATLSELEPSIVFEDRERILGSAEIWIRSADSRVFAAPNLIIHYVEKHQYRPPLEFIQAVEDAGRSHWLSREECESLQSRV